MNSQHLILKSNFIGNGSVLQLTSNVLVDKHLVGAESKRLRQPAACALINAA